MLDALAQELAAQRAPLREGRHAAGTCALLTSERYRRYLQQTRRRLPRIDRAAVAAEAKLDGKWVITTNDDTLSAEDLALGYKQLLRVGLLARHEERPAHAPGPPLNLDPSCPR